MIIAIIAIIIAIEMSSTSEELNTVGTRKAEKSLKLSAGVSKDKTSTHKAST